MKKDYCYRNNISLLFLLFFSYCTGEENNTSHSFLFHVQTYTKQKYHQCSQLFNHIRKIEMSRIIASTQNYNDIFSMRSQSLHSMICFFFKKIWTYIILIKKNKIETSKNTIIPKAIDPEIKVQDTKTKNGEPEERYKIRYINKQSFIKTLQKNEENSEDLSDESSIDESSYSDDYQSYSDDEESFMCSPIPQKATPINLSIIPYVPHNQKQHITITEIYNASLQKVPLLITKEARRLNYPKITKKPYSKPCKPITIKYIPQLINKSQKVENNSLHLLQ